MINIEIEQRIRSGIPLAENMDFRVQELSANTICVSGGAKENINVHNTAFAGSLYAICTLAVWGLVISRLPESAQLVIAEGNIRYRKPVTGEIIAKCHIEPDVIETFLEELQQKGKARLEALARVPGEAGNAVEFTGQLYARLAEE